VDLKTLIQGYVIPHAAPIATVFAATVAAVVAVTFGITQAGIATQQAATARTKLQLELFDRRLVVYNAVKDAWHNTVTSGDFPNECLEPYQVGINGVRWLFEDDVVVFVDNLYSLLINFHVANASLKGASAKGEEEFKKASDKQSRVFRELIQQQHEMDRLFGPYLKLKH
jgi:hypothetical protein